MLALALFVLPAVVSSSTPLGNVAPAAGANGAVPPSSREAPVALLADLSSGQVLFARDADKRFLPASMTKAMTALVAFDLIKSGKLDENATTVVSPALASRWAGRGTTLNLRAGEVVRIGDLLMGTTTVSANDAAVALADTAAGSVGAFVELMNARAANLGMHNSHFGTPNGFPDHGQTYVTARDLVLLATALISEHPVLYHRYFGHRSMIWRGGQYNSHDPFAGVLPGADGIKTGHTYEAGFNFLGAVERDARRLVVVIGGAPTEPARAAAAKSLAEWGYSAWTSHQFLPADSIVGAVRVQGGNLRRLPVAVPRTYSISLPPGEIRQASGLITYLGPLKAPIAKGQVIGQLELSLPGFDHYSLPVVAAQDVTRAGPIDRIVNALLELFA